MDPIAFYIKGFAVVIGATIALLFVASIVLNMIDPAYVTIH